MSVDPSGLLFFQSSGGTMEFTVSTNQKEWTVVSGKQWCIIKSKTENKFILEAAENPNISNRDTSLVTISAGDAQQVVIQISQLGSTPTLVLSPSITTLEFPAEITDDSQTFSVTTNETSWQAKVMTVDSLWCKVSINPSQNIFTIKPETNTNSSSRSTIVLVSGVKASSINITVNQKARTQNSTEDYEYDNGTTWD